MPDADICLFKRAHTELLAEHVVNVRYDNLSQEAIDVTKLK